MQRRYLNWKMAAPGAMPMSAWAWLNSMPTKTWAWHPALAVLLMLATGAGTGRANAPPAKADAPQPLPENLTDLGLKHYLAAIESPTTLSLHHTQVTDAGLKELAGLKSLQTLDLSTTQVTDTGLKELRMALPGCKIGPDIGPNVDNLLKLFKPLMSPAELPLPLLKKLAASKVPRPEAASRIALEYKFKAVGILAEERPVVAGLLIDNENDLIWVVRFTRIDRDPRFSQATDYEVRVSSTTGVAQRNISAGKIK